MKAVKNHSTRHDWLLVPEDPELQNLIAGFADEVREFAGRPYGELFEEIEEKNRLEKSEQVRKLRMEAARLLAETADPAGDVDVDPADIRLYVFKELWKRGRSFITSEADLFNPTAAEMFQDAARHFGLDEETVRSLLHADIPEVRRIVPPDSADAAEIVRLINTRRLRQRMRTVSSLEIRMPGSITKDSPYVSIFWMLKRLGLMYDARTDGEGIILSVTGPLALFEKTTVYGNRFASFVVHVLHGFASAQANALRIEAKSQSARQSILLTSAHADYFARHDSQTEEKLLRSGDEMAFRKYFEKAAPGWNIAFEGTLVPLQDDAGKHAGVFIPDFMLTHAEYQREILVEIVGYWREEYMRRKIEKMKMIKGREIYFFINAQLQAGGAAEGPEKQVSSGVKIRYYSGRRDLKRAVQEMAGEIEG